MNKTALIIGITGQDGSYLAKLLLEKGYKVFGATRDSLSCNKSRLIKLKIELCIEFISLAPNDFRSVLKVVDFTKPDEIYYLAGLTSVGLSFEQPVECTESISGGTLNFLEAIRFLNNKIKFFNAGSSECFGNTQKLPANENSLFSPKSPYATAKSTAFWQVANYREAYNLFCCTGILGNHESPLRPKRFVTQKIVSSVREIKSGLKSELRLGNLNTWRDWGWAPEYVEAIYLMLQNDIPEDFVIATGETNSLNYFVDLVFKKANLDKNKYVKIDSNYFRPTDIEFSNLDPSKIKRKLGWEAKMKLKDIISVMYEQL